VLVLGLVLISLAAALHPLKAQAEEREVLIGVLAKRGAARCLEKWAPTADYLSQAVAGHRFSIRPLGFDEVVPAAAASSVDFLVANSAFYVMVETLSGVDRIATMKNQHLGQAYTVFGGVIFRRADRGEIQSFQDLRAKSLMAVAARSLGGWLVAKRELFDAGIDPDADLGSLRFGETHDAVVLAVLAGEVDVGTVRTDTLERMAAEGKVRLEDFYVLRSENAAPDFPLEISTRVYPEWPFARTAGTSDALAEEVSAALLQMSPDTPAAAASSVMGWTIPHNYRPVHDCLMAVRAPPYETYGDISLADAILAYWPGILAVLLVLFAAFLGIYKITRLRHNLRLSEGARALLSERRAASEARERAMTREAELEATLRHSQKLDVVGQLAGGVAHDFNNILQGIGGYARLTLDERTLGESAREYVEQITRATIRAATLVRQLLTFGRRQIIEPKDVHLDEVVTELLHMLTRVLGEAVRIEFRPGTSSDVVRVDVGQVEQVLMNLCVNARDAMPDGGRLILETTRVVLDASACAADPGSKPGRYVSLSVSDTGTGMDEATLERVFEPFYTTKPQGKGTGLGLAMVYGIVTKHGGFVRVRSEIGRGTVFTVFFPIVASEDVQAAPAEEPSGEQRVGGDETILVAEDDDMVRDLAVRFLTRAGYSVLQVADGGDAVEMYEQRGDTIDLVVLDIVMPRMGGYETLGRLRALDPRVRALFCSGYDSPTVGSSLVPAAPMLQKPYAAKDLLGSVRTALDVPVEKDPLAPSPV
jgi:two-component system, sensor histidine kinase and response regulator